MICARCGRTLASVRWIILLIFILQVCLCSVSSWLCCDWVEGFRLSLSGDLHVMILNYPFCHHSFSGGLQYALHQSSSLAHIHSAWFDCWEDEGVAQVAPAKQQPIPVNLLSLAKTFLTCVWVSHHVRLALFATAIEKRNNSDSYFIYKQQYINCGELTTYIRTKKILFVPTDVDKHVQYYGRMEK